MIKGKPIQINCPTACARADATNCPGGSLCLRGHREPLHALYSSTRDDDDNNRVHAADACLYVYNPAPGWCPCGACDFGILPLNNGTCGVSVGYSYNYLACLDVVVSQVRGRRRRRHHHHQGSAGRSLAARSAMEVAVGMHMMVVAKRTESIGPAVELPRCVVSGGFAPGATESAEQPG